MPKPTSTTTPNPNTSTPRMPNERWKREVLAWAEQYAKFNPTQKENLSKVAALLEKLPDYHAQFFLENVIQLERGMELDYKKFYDAAISDNLTAVADGFVRFVRECKLNDLTDALTLLGKANAVPLQFAEAKAYAKAHQEQKEREEFEAKVQALMDETVFLSDEDLHADDLKVYKDESIKPWQQAFADWLIKDQKSPSTYILTLSLIKKLPDELCLFCRETLMQAESLGDILLSDHLTADETHKNALHNAQHYLTQADIYKDINRLNYFLFSLTEIDKTSGKPILTPIDPEAARAYFAAYEEKRLAAPEAIGVETKMPDGEEIEILTKKSATKEAKTPLERALKEKQDYFHNKAVDKDHFRAYMDKLKGLDPAKHAFLEKESAIWRKENEKLDEITLAYLDAKIEVHKLRASSQAVSDPKEKRAAEKAIAKATKQVSKLESKAEKTRESMQKALTKRIKAGYEYPDFIQFRRQQIQSSHLKFTPPEGERLLAQERVVEAETPIRERFILPKEKEHSPSVSTEKTPEPVPTKQVEQETLEDPDLEMEDRGSLH